jgi:hypothetical protein
MIITPTTTPAAFPTTAAVNLFPQYKAAYTGTAQVALRPKILMTVRPNIFDMEFYFPTCIRANYVMHVRLRNLTTNTTSVLTTVLLTDRVVYEDMEHQGGKHLIKNHDMRSTTFPPGNYSFSFVLLDSSNATMAVSLGQNYTIT